MNAMHSTAIGHPCLLAAETLHPRFMHDVWVAKRRVRVTLTVNFGYE